MQTRTAVFMERLYEFHAWFSTESVFYTKIRQVAPITRNTITTVFVGGYTNRTRTNRCYVA